MQTVLYFQSPGKISAAEKLAGTREMAAYYQWHVQVVGNIPDDRQIRALIQFWDPIAVIVDCAGGHEDNPFSCLRGYHTVFLDHNRQSLPSFAASVTHDSFATGTLAAKELLMTGFEYFAYVHPPISRSWSLAREEGFKKALMLNYRPVAVLDSEPTGKERISEYQLRLKRFMAKIPKPCAIFAANDQTAADVLATADLLELSVPRNVAIVGVDNDQAICKNTNPTLTTIEPDFRMGGRLAAQLVHDLVNGEITTKAAQLKYNPLGIVRRNSTYIDVGPDAEVARAMDLIRHNACTGLKARNVIKLFPCSRPLAESRFRKATGKSILQAIHERQLEQVKELLRQESISLAALSDFCGFRHPNSLRKFFRKETGMTLSHWRKTQQNNYL